MVSSNSAFIAAGSSIPYVVSKGALLSLTQCLTRALEPVVQVKRGGPGLGAHSLPEHQVCLPPTSGERLWDGAVPTIKVDDVARLVVDFKPRLARSPAGSSSSTGERRG